jgi:hypothetical protein
MNIVLNRIPANNLVLGDLAKFFSGGILEFLEFGYFVVFFFAPFFFKEYVFY